MVRVSRLGNGCCRLRRGLGLGDGGAFEASGLEFEVADRQAPWSGALPAVGGADASVEIAVSCP